MSDREQRAVRRASEDIRRAHRFHFSLVRRLATETPTAGGREIGLRLIRRSEEVARWAEDVLDRLRAMAAHGLGPVPPKATLWNRVAWKSVSLTWHLDSLLRFDSVRAKDPSPLDPRALLQRHLRWSADWLEFLEAHAPGFLMRLRADHPDFGPLDPFAWARFLVIFSRKIELSEG